MAQASSKEAWGGQGRRVDALAWVLFAVLGLVFFWEVLFGWGGTRQYFWDDFLEFVYPTRFFAAVSLDRGDVPFWNPYVFAGMPFLADIQSAVFYPLNLLLTPLVRGGHLPLTAVEALAVLHIILAGVWMYLLARRLGVTYWGALVSGTAYMFSGFLVTHVIHLNVLEVAIWLPLAFLFMHLAFERESAFWAVLAGAVLAVSFLGGSPQILLLCYVGLGFFTVYEIARAMGRRRTFSPQWLRVPTLGALAVAFSLGLAAFQLLPSLELSKLSVRPELTYEQSVHCSVPPQNLITFFIPHFFGTTAGRDFSSYWGVGRYYFFWETCGYVGVVSLLLAWIGLRRSERPHRHFFAALAVIALLMAAGKYGGIHRLFFAVVPGYDRFRVPSRALMLFVFAASVLAGYGTEVLTGSLRGGLRAWLRRLAGQWGLFSAVVLVSAVLLFRYLGLGRTLMSGVPVDWGYFVRAAVPFVVFAGAGAGLLAVRARGVLPAWATGLALVGLVVADLFVFGRSHNLCSIPPDQYYTEGSVVEMLKPAEGEPLFRVQTRAVGGTVVIRRNQGEMIGVFNIDGYNQLKLNLYEAFEVERDLKLDLLNARYRVRPGPTPNTLEVVEASTYLPRAWVVPEVALVEDGEGALEIMGGQGFNPWRTAVLGTPGPWVGEAPPASADSWAEIVSYESNRIEVNADVDGRGILMFSEIHYPRWVAHVDGERRPVLRADYALRAVPLEEGSHRVVMAYEPRSFRRGLVVSGACLLGGLALVVVRRMGVRV